MLKIGIIGAGGIAGQHATCYESIPEAKVVAVADIIPGRAEMLAKRFDAEALDHGDKIMERDDVDVVDICLPTYLHCEYVLKAAKAGKHILCEKPMALSIKEGLKMIEAAENAGVKFMVAQVLRYFPENISAKKVMEDGSIGKPVMVRTYRGGVHPDRTREWYGQDEKSGGAIVDMAIHDIDFLKWCFGPVKEVYAKGNVSKKTPHLEYDLITMEFENGVLTHSIADWARPLGGHFTTKMEIVGTKGIVEYDMDKSAPLQILASSVENTKDSVAIPESPLSGRSNPYTKEIIDFLSCVENNTKPPIPAVEALESLNVALKAVESIKLKKPIKVQEVL